MAALAHTYPDLADLYKQREGDGSITAQIIDLIKPINPILDDMVVYPCNNGTTHLTTVRTGYASGTWRKLYGGVQPSTGSRRQVQDTTGMYESWCEIDAKLVDLAEDKAQFRLNEAGDNLGGMQKDMASALFYSDDAATPEQFKGLAARFDTPSATAGEAGYQMIDGTGVGADNTSIWLVVWGPTTVHALYPKGSKAGLTREDKGVQTKTNSDGSVLDVYREKFGWDIGLTVRDFRYVARICNIDVSNMKAGSVDVFALLRKAFYRVHQWQVPNGRPAIYCNKDVMEVLDAESANAGSGDNFVRLRPMEIEGRMVDTYKGIPIRPTDAILNSEAAITGTFAS